MSTSSVRRLVILSGPSCVGKSPLKKALSRLYPDLCRQLTLLVLYNSRAPRPGEKEGVDYHFRTRYQIEAMQRDERFVILDVRGDLQALDLAELLSVLNGSDAFFEGNPFVGRMLLTHDRLSRFRRLSIFLSPFNAEELSYLVRVGNVSLPELVADVMRSKLLRRMKKQKGTPSLKDLEEVERRCSSAYNELKEAVHFDHVIPNHDGEDSDNWDAFYYPLGDARKAMLAFAALLRGGTTDLVEKWPANLLP
jgi:guanylate kinase